MATATNQSVIRKKVSVIIPALNEEAGIIRTIEAIPRTALAKMNYDLEVVVVDNGSTDKTGEMAKSAGATVVYESKRGYGNAYKAGFNAATGDIIATGDADATYPLEDIPALIEILDKEGLDFITTDRFGSMEEGAMSFQNKIGNGVLNIVTRVLYGVNIRDSQSGMWVFKRSILQGMTLRSCGMPLSEELKLEACYFQKCPWKEVPIKYRSRAGKVKLRAWRDGFSNLAYLCRKRIAR
ncbi:MAG: glycosyltransferase family 2 protein [Dehalococcoidia bacterium]